MHALLRASLTAAVVAGLALVPAPVSTQAPPANRAANAPYQDLSLDFEARAADLVGRMTLEEKIAQLMNDAPAIPRLGVPAYDWWNEALHGVARAGTATVFPQAIGMAATFDTRADARGRHRDRRRRRAPSTTSSCAAASAARYQGLTFWSPNINIFRDPRWGRGQETYGEDPYLTGAHGRRVRQGAAGRRPEVPGRRSRRRSTSPSTAGPRRTATLRRHARASATCTRPTCRRSRRWCRKAKVASVMGAYNRVNGESASASPRLLLGRSCAATGASTATSCPTAAPSTTSTRATRSSPTPRRPRRWR